MMLIIIFGIIKKMMEKLPPYQSRDNRIIIIGIGMLCFAPC